MTDAGPGASPEVFALIGDPVAGNPTPQVVEDGLRHLGMESRYVSFRVPPDRLPAAVDGLRALGFRGAHVTVPHKVAVVDLLDELDPATARVGAVNCITSHDGTLVGHNTDGVGFRAAAAAVTLDGAHVTIFGAGGAAQAIAVELAAAGVRHLSIVNRDTMRADRLRRLVGSFGPCCDVLAWPDRPVAPAADLIVNATTVGMPGVAADARIPVDWSAVPTTTVAADVVIADGTEFLAAAAATGHETVSGIDMLVEQIAYSLRLWTGRDADRTRMRRLLTGNA